MPGKTLVWAIYAGAIYLDCPDDAELQRTGSHMAFPDERVAVVVLTNQDSVDTSAALTFTPPASLSQRYEMTSPAESLRVIQRNSFTVDNGFMLHMNAPVWTSEAPRHARVEDSAGIHRAQCPH